MSLSYPFVNVKVSDSGGDNTAEVEVNITVLNGLTPDLEDLTDVVETYLLGLAGADHVLSTKYEVTVTSPF